MERNRKLQQKARPDEVAIKGTVQPDVVGQRHPSMDDPSFTEEVAASGISYEDWVATKRAGDDEQG